MFSRVITLVLCVGIILSAITWFANQGNIRLQGNQQNYEPLQPIAYSHRLHAGELAIPCLYCHFGAEKSRHAGVPAASTCMKCHEFVTATFGAIRAEDELAIEEERDPLPLVSEELQKLYDSLGLDSEMKPDPAKTPRPIEWVRVHNLPDYVYFDHRPHVSSGLDCQRCHGAVESMERMRQIETLSMGWCVNCHRDVNETGVAGQSVNASIDCVTCHF